MPSAAVLTASALPLTPASARTRRTGALHKGWLGLALREAVAVGVPLREAVAAGVPLGEPVEEGLPEAVG